MATRMIRMSKIREILNLHSAGHKERAIARATGVSRTAVKNTLYRTNAAGVDWERAKQLDDATLREIVYPEKRRSDEDRYLALKQRLPLILKNLGKKHMTLDVQWEEYKIAYPNGYEYSRFCDYIRDEAKTAEVYLGMQYGYGEMMFVDYAGEGHYYINLLTGSRVDVNLFVAILPASQYTFGEFTPTQKTADWIGASDNSLRFFGGSVGTIVPDCAKPVVSHVDRYGSEIQMQYWNFADYYQAIVTPARPRHPRDKALVESSINNIYRWVYPRLARQEYYSLAELNEALRILMAQYNARCMRLYGCSRLELFDSYERATLKPLPQWPYEFKHYQPPTRAAFNGHLWLKDDLHYYSVPERLSGQLCAAFYNATSVEIFHENARICTHPRNYNKSRKYTTTPEHLPRHHLEYMKWTPDRFQSWSHETGPNVEAFILSLLDTARHFTHSYRLCMALMSLRKRYTNLRLDRACQMVLGTGSNNTKRVVSILEKGTDLLPDEQLVLPGLPQANPNLRHINHKEQIA